MASFEPTRTSVSPAPQSGEEPTISRAARSPDTATNIDNYQTSQRFRQKYNRGPGVSAEIVNMGVSQVEINKMIRENNRRTINVYRDHEFMFRFRDALKADTSRPLHERVTGFLLALKEESRALESAHSDRMMTIEIHGRGEEGYISGMTHGTDCASLWRLSSVALPFIQAKMKERDERRRARMIAKMPKFRKLGGFPARQQQALGVF
ncbi:hypothetical protein BDZ85DRAFT_57603 [Elsinoe ampelina]|uniref:Uncharacterized protein n=1 Tax=Elsinoe ampelina TaxID=302913 RepID=A0A6A6GMS1_9PEZI|nr:hypothetical protein BDZ85DRAFT_57603 [Elsinoe ampelina]